MLCNPLDNNKIVLANTEFKRLFKLLERVDPSDKDLNLDDV